MGLTPEIKILRIDEFDAGRRARAADESRLNYPHLCIYKIVTKKKAAYYFRWLDQNVAHQSPPEIQKWLREHLNEEANTLLDEVELA